MLTVKNLSLSKLRRKEPILKEISLEFSPGSITMLLGKSGSGKSSLLRCLAQLETEYEGTIENQGHSLKNLTAFQRGGYISFISQSYALFPHLTAFNNCVQPLRVVCGLSEKEASQKALTIMTSLGMQEYTSAYPCELSGGQQQRIAIARALALNPAVLLLDEPSSALDPQNSNQLAQILQELASQGKTIVIASQDMTFVSQLSAHTYYFEEGRIII